MGHTNMRTTYGETLVELGNTNENIVVLDADLGGSTMGKLFEQAYPERHIECGIAEQNMLSVSAGLSVAGKIPFAGSFAVFAAGRAFDQIRQTICIGKLNVKVCGSSCGCSDFGDGATHQSVEDVAIMRAIPNMTVLVPADANEMVKVVKAAAEYEGPVYIRCGRNEYENTTAEDAPFEIGKPSVLKEGTDVCVFAMGYMNNLALEAAKQLEGKVSVKVVNVSTVKPMCPEYIQKLAAGCKSIVTVEEHNIVGGLGSAIAEAMCSNPLPMKMVGIHDKFGTSAHAWDDVLNYMGLTVDAVKAAIEEMA